MPVSPERDAGGDRSPLWISGYMDGPASPVSVPSPTEASRGRLNGFPEAFAGVFRHHVGGGSETRSRTIWPNRREENEFCGTRDADRATRTSGERANVGTMMYIVANRSSSQ